MRRESLGLSYGIFANRLLSGMANRLCAGVEIAVE